MNETGAISNEAYRLPGKWRVLLGVVVAFILISFVVAPPIVQNYQTIQRFSKNQEMCGSYVSTEPGWLANLLPDQWELELRRHSWIQPFETIVSIQLKDIRMSNADLAVLKKMKNLEYLSFFNTDVTSEEFEELKATLPDCKIRWSLGSWSIMDE